MKKKIIICIAIYILGIMTPIILSNLKKDILHNQVIYKVRINREYINMRAEVNLNSDIIREVYKDEVFEVVKYYEGSIYNWYNIIYEDGKTAWIASSKEDSWVIIEN